MILLPDECGWNWDFAGVLPKIRRASGSFWVWGLGPGGARVRVRLEKVSVPLHRLRSGGVEAVSRVGNCRIGGRSQVYPVQCAAT